MNDLVVKNVDLMGDTIMAAKDLDNVIWVGINSFCQGLRMNKKQRDWQVEKVKSDNTLSRGCRELPAGVFDIGNAVYALRLDFIPLWLAKISITDKMQEEHPELAEKLLNYQLKAKDILAEAFLPKQNTMPTTTDGKIALLAQGHVELKAEIDSIKASVEELKNDMPAFSCDTKDIQTEVKKKAVEVMGGKDSNAYRDKSTRSYVFADIQMMLRREFGVRRYEEIKHKRVDEAIRLIREYRLPLVLTERIDTVNAQQSFGF